MRTALAAVALAVVASACGSGSSTPSPVPTLPAPSGRTVVAVTAGTLSGRRALTVQVGTVINVRLLDGATHISTFHSPAIGDRSILHTWPAGTEDQVSDGAYSDYIAMRPGTTTIDAAIGATHLLVDVTVTAASPSP